MKTPYLLTPVLALAALSLQACKTPTKYYCETDTDCVAWPGRPFCDVAGDYPASEGIGKTCIPDPTPDAGVDPDGGDDQDGGEGDFCDTCALGCDESGTRCLMIEPSNGLAPFLESAADLGDVTLPAGTTINTDTGVVVSPDGPIAVTNTSIAQTGGTDLRVFSARSFAIGDVRVQGSLPVAFVASGNVEIVGIIDVSADMNTPGPGALDCEDGGAGGEPDGGHFTPRLAGSEVSGEFVWCSAGSGGGGFGTPGAPGGDFTTREYTPGQGGSVNGALSLVPLRGGCPGGGDDPGTAGGGGGAVQIVSGGQLLVTAAGGLHAGGGGGGGASDGRTDGGDEPIWPAAGGGSGGGILLEAATVVFEETARVLAAGGGGGGSGGCDQEIRSGDDAPANGSTAAGGECPMEGWGQPALGGAGAAVSAAQPGMDIDYHSGGGGGGGLGRIRINTPDGGFTGEDLVIIRGALTTGTVDVH